MFKEVSGVGHIESFYGTQSMKVGDLVLLHVGQQDKNYESGIYAYGTIVEDPRLIEDEPDDRRNGRIRVLVRFDKIVQKRPLILHENCKAFVNQYRTVHRIDPKHYGKIKELLCSF